MTLSEERSALDGNTLTLFIYSPYNTSQSTKEGQRFETEWNQTVCWQLKGIKEIFELNHESINENWNSNWLINLFPQIKVIVSFSSSHSSHELYEAMNEVKRKKT